MARKTIVELFDDVSGEAIDENLVQNPTTVFSVDGVDYEIELGMESRRKFDQALEPFIINARKVSKRKKARGTQGSGAGGKSESTAAREWAISQGIDVPARGRVSRGIIEQWREETR